MTRNNQTLFDIINKSFIGFEDLPRLANTEKYPKYDIIKTDKGSLVEVALAGFSKEDIKIEVKNGILSISSDGVDLSDVEHITRAIARRGFSLRWKINEGYEVTKAEMSNGLLTIELEKEEKEPDVKLIEIQ